MTTSLSIERLLALASGSGNVGIVTHSEAIAMARDILALQHNLEKEAKHRAHANRRADKAELKLKSYKAKVRATRGEWVTVEWEQDAETYNEPEQTAEVSPQEAQEP